MITKLYSKNKSGKLLEWTITTLPVNEDGHVPIQIVFGQVGGKLQTKLRYVKSGKNKGKVNETTVESQAELELGYLVQKQLDQGYVDDIEKYVEPKRPQLAHKYKDKKHLVKFVSDEADPNKKYYGSKKLNGIRCFIFIKNGEVVSFESRTGKEFKFFNHIAKDILVDNAEDKSFILDGELFNPDIPFEVICSLVNSDDYTSVDYDGKTYTTDMIQFHCYDYIGTDESLGYYQRFISNTALDTFGDSFIVVQNVIIDSEEFMIDLTKEWMAEGYEGLMLRYAETAYEFGRRSVSLLKIKLFESDEFKILNIFLAENDSTKTMFTLENHFGLSEEYKTFDCSIKGNKEYNLQYYNNLQSYLGKWCTVTYQALSSYNVPLFAQIEAIRDGEVVDGDFQPTY